MREELLAQIFKAMGTEPFEIIEDQQLLDLGFNSISFITFIVAVEEKYEVEFEDDYLDFARYNSLEELFDYITMLISSK